jgi:hypothetical protein
MKQTRNGRYKTTASIEDEISKITEDLASLGRVPGENASAEVRAAGRSPGQRIDNLANDANFPRQDVVEGAERTITESPFTVIGSTFALGLVLSPCSCTAERCAQARSLGARTGNDRWLRRGYASEPRPAK